MPRLFKYIIVYNIYITIVCVDSGFINLVGS